MPNFVHSKVDPDHLSRVTTEIEDSLRLVEKALGVVDDSLKNTLLPTWSGPASSLFFSQYSNDSQSFSSLVRALRAYNEKLRQAAGAYADADDMAGDMVDSLKLE